MTDKRYVHFIKHVVESDDRKSFESLFKIFHSRLYKFAFSISKSSIIADEIVMDIFMNLWKKRKEMQKIANLETYLYVAVRNHSINVVKKESRFHFDSLENSHISLANYELNPENSLISSEMLKNLNRAVEKLPAKCKIIFKLIREDGLSRNEVAEILALSPKTIDNQVTIAVKKIAEALQFDLSTSKNRIKLTQFLLIS